MKITKIDIPKSTDNNDGLEHIKMDKLNNIVLIAGKNGSGKTRILNKIFTMLKSKPTQTSLFNAETQIVTDRNNLGIFENAIFNDSQMLHSTIDELSVRNRENQIQQYRKGITNSKLSIEKLESAINWKFIETSESSDKYAIEQFVPKNLDLQDCSLLPLSAMLIHAESINSVGMTKLQQGTFAKIQVVQNLWFEVTHQLSDASNEDKLSATKDYDKLKQIIGIFLNTTVGRTNKAEATLFGFPLGKTNLSDGQKILLQFCLAIYSQETDLKDLILILDEPENHLHPSVIIEVIEKIKNSVTNGQIWIATHSIPLLAHFDPSLIWYVENSKIVHAGKIPEKVLESLLGNEDEVAKLQDFISLPSQYASIRYALESLFEPRVVITGSNDPQSQQIRRDLLEIKSGSKLTILDYGSGKGRLISNIVDIDSNSEENLIDSIDYIAYDKFPNDKEQCEIALTKAYGDCNKRYFNDFNSLLSVHDKGSFDVVIMCNVLHEIDPINWIRLFQSGGEISSLLSEKGILLLVEDHQIPIGEKAYQNGFLVLDTPQLKELFKITAKDTDFDFSDSRGNGRLKAHRIPKNCLIRIDATSRESAIRSMSSLAKDRIMDIRKIEKSSYQNGKLHGFWTQQFANAQLSLSELTIT